MQKLSPPLLIALLCLIMAACGSNQPSPTPEPTDYSLEGTVTAPSGFIVAGTLVVACYPTGDACDETKSAYTEINSESTSANFSLNELDNAAYDLFAIQDTSGDGEYGPGDLYAELNGSVTPPKSGLTLNLSLLTDDPGVPGEPGPTDPGTPGEPGGPAQTSRFFLFTGDEVRTTTNPRIETDAQGGVHMVYPAYAVGDAFYTYCPANCTTLNEVATVKLPTTGTVDNAMIALDSSGKPHILLSTYERVYYATCAGDCRQAGAWTVSPVLEHSGDFEVSGEAFALDPQNRPRFLMHPYRSLAPIGGSAPAAYLVACDATCENAASWTRSQVSSQLWQESSLRYSADGAAHVGTTVTIDGEGLATAYLTCSATCSDENSWDGVALYRGYADPYVSEIRPTVSLALTNDGRPRMVAQGDDDTTGRTLLYFECDAACTTGDGWQLNALLDGSAAAALGPGLDLALDANDHPRFVYNADYNILLAYCDGNNCGDGNANEWDLKPLELSGDIPADQVIPYYNCSVSAWFLREPSLAIGPDGLPRVAYRAEDISGPYGNPDPNHPACTTGADMTLTRFAQLGSYN